MAPKAEQPHVFVINDEPTLLEVFRELLEEEGFRVSLETFAGHDVNAQYARIVAERPALVVLDFIIGGEPLGWQFLQILRMRRATAKVPVIVCTAARHTVEELADRLSELAIDVVLKPFEIDELLVKIRRALDATPDDPWEPVPGA